MTGAPEVVVVPDGIALADAAAERVEELAIAATPQRPATIALAGGSTPKSMYQHLGSRCLPFVRMRLFFGDERCVPPDDPGSNYRMVREALLVRTGFPEGLVHRIPGELPPQEGADAAERDLRAAFPGQDPPRLDMVLLGLGPDGHTASLFPGAPELAITDRWMVPVHRPEMPQPWRVSMTLAVLCAAGRVLFVADDPEKAEVVARAIAGDPELPAGLVRPTDGMLTFIITERTATAL
ncbi:MAG: 6-phosphogluconolactonase [Thermoleophilia bacterium]